PGEPPLHVQPPALEEGQHWYRRRHRLIGSSARATVAPRTDVATWIDRTATDRARGAPGPDQRDGTLDEGRGLGATQADAGRAGVAGRRPLRPSRAFRLLLVLCHLLDLDDDAVGLLVVADSDGPDDPRGCDRLPEGQVPLLGRG